MAKLFFYGSSEEYRKNYDRIFSAKDKTKSIKRSSNNKTQVKNPCDMTHKWGAYIKKWGFWG